MAVTRLLQAETKPEKDNGNVARKLKKQRGRVVFGVRFEGRVEKKGICRWAERAEERTRYDLFWKQANKRGRVFAFVL